jgi:hypothetical protein
MQRVPYCLTVLQLTVHLVLLLLLLVLSACSSMLPKWPRTAQQVWQTLLPLVGWCWVRTGHCG